MSKKIIWIVVGGSAVLVIALVLSGGSSPSTTSISNTTVYRPNTESPAAYEQIASISFETYAGETVTLASLGGGDTPLIVNAWATWCPFCVDELPDFAAFQEKFGERVRVIAIDRAESLEQAKKFSDDVGVTNIITMLLDKDDAFYRAIGGFSMPETLFITANGTIADHKRGPMTLEEIRARANQAFGL